MTQPIMLSGVRAGKMNFAAIVKYLLINKGDVYVGANDAFIKQIEAFYPTLRKQVFSELEWKIHTSKQGEMNLVYDEASQKFDDFNTP